MLEELCAEVKNYFLDNRENDIHDGEYTISNGSIDLPFLKNGQYFRIVGSVLNNGVYQYPVSELTDETFVGAVWAMNVPPAFVALSAEIDAWNEKNAEAISSPYTSESFGGYSYSKASGISGGGGYSWQDQFESRLKRWRRLSVL